MPTSRHFSYHRLGGALALKILYIHQYFCTNEGASGTRSYDVSRYLVQRGHQVTMVCGITERGTFLPGPWYRPLRVEWVDGIKVIICNTRYSNKMGVFRRMWVFFGFAFLATLACLAEPSVDIVFATSTPLTVGIPGRLAATVKRAPFVFEVRDLWPEDLLAADRIKPGLQYKAWEWLESFCYARARKIVLVSKGFYDRLLERGFDSRRLETILLGADGELFGNLKPDREYIERHGLAGKIIAVYTGAHGDANGLFQLLEAAEHLRDRPDVAIVLIGDGKMRAGLRADAREKGLTNVHFLDSLPKKDLVHVMAACHIGLMILKPIRRPRWVTPNKLFDYMFAGLPTVVNFAGTTAELVEADGVGVASKPGSAEDLAARVLYWADHPEERAAIGQRARELAFKKYDRTMIAQRLAFVFESCLRR